MFAQSHAKDTPVMISESSWRLATEHAVYFLAWHDQVHDKFGLVHTDRVGQCFQVAGGFRRTLVRNIKPILPMFLDKVNTHRTHDRWPTTALSTETCAQACRAKQPRYHIVERAHRSDVCVTRRCKITVSSYTIWARSASTRSREIELGAY